MEFEHIMVNFSQYFVVVFFRDCWCCVAAANINNGDLQKAQLLLNGSDKITT